MSRPLLQNLNQSRSQDHSAFNSDLAASPFTGSVNDNILLWQAANQVVTGPGADFTIANSATLGTTVQINKKGVYFVELGVALISAAAAVVLGISQDVAAAALTGNILIGTAGALVASSIITLVDADFHFEALSTMVFVSPEQEVGGTIIRFHAGAAAGAPPTVMLAATTTYYRIRRIGDNNI